MLKCLLKTSLSISDQVSYCTESLGVNVTVFTIIMDFLGTQAEQLQEARKKKRKGGQEKKLSKSASTE